MEHLRAFMLVNTLHEMDMKPFFYPSDIETNPETANDIIENGFYLGFPTEKDLELASKAVDQAQNISSYEMIQNPASKQEESNADLLVSGGCACACCRCRTEKGDCGAETEAEGCRRQIACCTAPCDQAGPDQR